MKIDWDLYFLTLAFVVSQKSKDPSTKHGSLIVDKNNRVISMGYNGIPQNVVDDIVDMSTEDRYAVTLHSEANAILFAKQDLRGCKLYCTGWSCTGCTKLIIQSGISEVICASVKSRMVDEKEEELSRKMFRSAGIKLKEFGPTLYTTGMVSEFLNQTKKYINDRWI